jgi:tRNA nucleotidyltransferase/poly(A) polymerase
LREKYRLTDHNKVKMGVKFFIEIPKKLARVLEELPFAYPVGGSVRDALLGESSKVSIDAANPEI